MSTPPPGWQPDPSQASQSQPVLPVASPALAASPIGAYEAPAPGLDPLVSAPAAAPVFSAAPAPTATGQLTLTQRNPTTFMAVFVVALYLVLAASTGIVLVGIFPAMLAFRALQRREPLAVLAVVAAAVAIVFSMTVLTAH